MSFGGFMLDLDRDTLSGSGGEIRLRPKTFEVLRYLLMHRGRVVTKQALIDEVWRNTSVTDDSLVQCLIEIRRALGDRSTRNFSCAEVHAEARSRRSPAGTRTRLAEQPASAKSCIPWVPRFLSDERASRGHQCPGR